MIASWGLRLIERSYSETAERDWLLCAGLQVWLIPVSPAQSEALQRSAREMANAVAHRGPDGEGCGLMQRLASRFHTADATIDLSEAGAQPMLSADGRWVLSYNGETCSTEGSRSSPG